MLLEIFGETGVWVLDAEKVCCQYCVDMMNYHDNHHLERIRIRTKYWTNYFWRADCRHKYVFPLKGDAGSEVCSCHTIFLLGEELMRCNRIS